MARKQPTPEQQAKAIERRERFGNLVKTIAALSEDERMARVTARGGNIGTIEGRTLSVFNTILLIVQNPEVSVVGGFQQWKENGRSVRKGEHGMMIWIPTGGKSDNGGPADASNGGEPIADAADAAANPRTRFIMGTMFDISQTDLIVSPIGMPATELSKKFAGKLGMSPETPAGIVADAIEEAGHNEAAETIRGEW